MQKEIKRIPLQFEIINYIQNYIKENNMKPGDKLPSQAELIEMMGVSRSALRESMKTLEAKDIIEMKNGKGAYVKENFVSALAAQLNFTKEKEMLVQMIEVRKVLEREILKLVIHNADDKELEELGKVVKILIDKYSKGEVQTKEDHKFHYMIYEISHHKIFQQLIQVLSDSMNKLWEFPLNMENPFTNTIPLHEELYKALRERNLKKAREVNDKILNDMIKDIKRQI